MSFGRDRLAKDWLSRASIQIRRKLLALLGILESQLEVYRLNVVSLGAVSDAHVNASDYERLRDSHVKDDVVVSFGTSPRLLHPVRPALARARRCTGY